MNLKFSRHAKRRMKLYGISEEIVKNILVDSENIEERLVVKKVPGFNYSIKVVYENK